MANNGEPNWDGLLKWSLAHSDGTHPTRNFSEEERRWFMEAMQSQSVDVVKRMKEISLVLQTPDQVLESHGVTASDLEDLLDELQEHVESIDMANDLHSIGGLVPLLGYLKHSKPNIRAKAAEVVTTIVQNNPKSQQLVMESNGFEPLISNFSSDPDLTVRTKSLGAISSLIRHNKPGITAFRLANGYSALKDALSSESVRFQRKALNLIHYLLQESSSDISIVNELGFPRIMTHLVSSEDSEVREASLRGLLELRRNSDLTNNNNIDSDDNNKLKQILQNRIDDISSMSPEDLGAAREETQLVDSLWNVSFNEPSSLNVLAGEEESGSAPDVASRLFEPPLRAWAANCPQNENDKKSAPPPLLLGSGPGPGSSSANQ